MGFRSPVDSIRAAAAGQAAARISRKVQKTLHIFLDAPRDVRYFLHVERGGVRCRD